MSLFFTFPGGGVGGLKGEFKKAFELICIV